MTDTKKPATTVAQDVAALRAIADGAHATPETPAEVLADITIKPTITREEAQTYQHWTGMDGATAWHLIERHAENWADVGLMMGAWFDANRTLAAGKVDKRTPIAWAEDCDYGRGYSFAEEFFEAFPTFPNPPADPAKASEPDEVRIDFPGIGHAGPFAVKDGEITLSAATMSDLAHHFRMGYVAKASGSVQVKCGACDNEACWGCDGVQGKASGSAQEWQAITGENPEPGTHGPYVVADDFYQRPAIAARTGLGWFICTATRVRLPFDPVHFMPLSGLLAATPPASAPEVTHPDDIAVDRFAAEMKAKLATARAKGRGGWDGPECNADILSRMLREHVNKGDPRDVANFCMFLWNRGEAIAPEGNGHG